MLRVWQGVEGFSLALSYVARLREGGLLWLAPVCSSFAFPNISNTKRSAADYNGDPTYEPVATGNLMAELAGFLMRLAFERGLLALSRR